MDADADARLRLLESAHVVSELRVSQLESWQRRDEPRVSELVKQRELAEEVRRALNERSRQEWSRTQKALALLAGVGVTVGMIPGFVQLAHLLHL